MCSSSLLDNLSENQSISNNNIPQKNLVTSTNSKKNILKKISKRFLIDSLRCFIIPYYKHHFQRIFIQQNANKKKHRDKGSSKKKEEQNKKISNFLQYSRLYKSENPNANIINRGFFVVVFERGAATEDL